MVERLKFWFWMCTAWSYDRVEKLINSYDFRKFQDNKVFDMLCNKVDSYVRDHNLDADNVLILINCIPKGDEKDGFPMYKTHLEHSLGLRLEYLLESDLGCLRDYDSCIVRIQYIATQTGGYEIIHRYLIAGLDTLVRLSKKTYGEVAFDIENSNAFNVDNEGFWRELKNRVVDPHPQYSYFIEMS